MKYHCLQCGNMENRARPLRAKYAGDYMNVCEECYEYHHEKKARDEVREIFEELMLVHDVAFHPDTPLEDYPYIMKNFTAKKREIIEEIIENAFRMLGDEVYEIGLDVQQKAMGTDNPAREESGPAKVCISSDIDSLLDWINRHRTNSQLDISVEQVTENRWQAIITVADGGKS